MTTFLVVLISILLGCSANDSGNVKRKLAFPFKSHYKIKHIRPVISGLKTPEVINQTFLGNEKRNYYGNEAPSSLNIIWKTKLGTGQTRVGSEVKTWSGAGWTGQPLMIRQNDTLYIIQGAYDHNLKKIRVSDGKIIAQYQFDDVIKGTGSIWTKYDSLGNFEDFYILQGSRMGFKNYLSSPLCPSLREIKFSNMSNTWQLNSVRTKSYSRDCDGSALILNDTAYIGLENGYFTVFDPNPKYAALKEGLKQPKIYSTDSLFLLTDVNTHGGNLVTESSPSYMNGKIYITSGSGHIFGYNMKTKKIDWRFDTGSDMDGSPVVTYDSCIIVGLEKQYISGNGGVMKLNPALPPDKAVVWFFPTDIVHFVFWDGGVIGSTSINDFYSDSVHLAAFAAIDGNLYVVKHDEIDKTKTAKSPDGKKTYPMPKLVFKYQTGPSISTPLIVGNKIIDATYNGLYLFEFDKNLKFKLLALYDQSSFEATPFVWNKKIYIASRDGNLYCFGD